jgi:16S rRNA (guanine966-N2)-methyltransferase
VDAICDSKVPLPFCTPIAFERPQYHRSTLVMRVIAGKYRSRPLSALPGLDLRPTTDRLRETLFNVLTAGNPSALEGTVWLDLYAGTGAVGIEALSRGAEMVYFVDSSARATDLVRKNLQSLKIEFGFEIVRKDSVQSLRGLEARGVTADFAFLDPPYRRQPAYQQTLERLGQVRLLKPGSIVIAEHEKRFDPGEKFEALGRYRTLTQGDAALSFYRIR